MSLTYHTAILTPATFANDSTESTKSKLNLNFTLGKTELQGAVDPIQDALSTLHGEGLLSLPTVTTSGSSLSVTISTFKALIGEEIVYGGGTATLLASQTGASLYFQGDGTFATMLPTSKSYCVVGTYTTTLTGCTTFTVSTGMLIPKLVTVTGTVSGIYVPDNTDTAEGYVDHSATALFAIDGCLKLTVSDVAFTVEELYCGGMVDKDSSYVNDPPHQRTNGGFWYKLTRGAGYSYAGDPTVDLTYTRTGMTLAS